MINRTLALASILACLASTAMAAPTLRSEVTIIGPIVTIGDMFDDAGLMAERGLFRSPLPGTTGTVTLEQLRHAAAAAGLADYSTEGVMRVRVTRPAVMVDAAMLTGFISHDLDVRGLVRGDAELDVSFDQPPTYAAEAVARPVEMLALNYAPGNTSFVARFLIAGRDAPVEVSGRIQMMVRAPHLVATYAAGTILGPQDIEMRPVPAGTIDVSAIAGLEQLLGKQLTRQSRAGMMLKPSDVTEPTVIERNAVVTLLVDSGPMRLTAKGQALASAAVGQPVQVLNTSSRRIVTGTAQADGTVAISPHQNIAGL